MSIFGAVEEKEENRLVGQPVDEITEEFLRGLVDPVQVLQDQKKGSALGSRAEEVPEALESPFLLLAGLQMEEGLILYFQGKELLEGRKQAPEGGSRAETFSENFL